MGRNWLDSKKKRTRVDDTGVDCSSAGVVITSETVVDAVVHRGRDLCLGIHYLYLIK
jgi:hypothetical protein